MLLNALPVAEETLSQTDPAAAKSSSWVKGLAAAAVGADAAAAGAGADATADAAAVGAAAAGADADADAAAAGAAADAGSGVKASSNEKLLLGRLASSKEKVAMY